VASWWESISEEELVALRRRLLLLLRMNFPGCGISDLEDTVQAAFLGMLVHRENVSPERDGLFRYLRTAARNHMIDRWRHTRVRECPKTPHTGPVAGREPPDALVHAENIERIKEYLHQLDDLSRWIIWRHVVDGASIRAVAQGLNRDRHAVKGILEAAFARVRRLIERER